MLEKTPPTYYLLMDFELTGLHPVVCGVTEIAVAILDERLEILETYVSDVRPPDDVVIDEDGLSISGMTRERMAAGKPYDQVADDLLALFDRHLKGIKPVMVGQFLPVDYACLCQIFESKYRENKKILFEKVGNNFVDTKSLVNFANMLARKKGVPVPFVCTSLSACGGLKEFFGCSKDMTSHTALGDVMATRDVLKCLLDQLPGLLMKISLRPDIYEDWALRKSLFSRILGRIFPHRS